MPWDVVHRRVPRWVASNIHLPFSLINSNVINVKLRWKVQSRKIDVLERFGDGEIKDNRLIVRVSTRNYESKRNRTIGSSGINLCPTPVPSGKGSGATAPAPILNVGTPPACHSMYPCDGLLGSVQYSNPIHDKNQTNVERLHKNFCAPKV